jgi:hypothetical protein
MVRVLPVASHRQQECECTTPKVGGTGRAGEGRFAETAFVGTARGGLNRVECAVSHNCHVDLVRPLGMQWLFLGLLRLVLQELAQAALGRLLAALWCAL